MIIVILLFIIIGLAVDYYIAKAFYSIARMKGHDEEKYLWWCFFFTAVGYLMVIALPDRCGNHSNLVMDELPEL